MRELIRAHLSEVTVVNGADDYSGLSIEETVRRRGAMTLLLIVARRVLNDHGWPFRERCEASTILKDCWGALWVERWGAA